MAPQNKRAAVATKAPVAAKKAKVVAEPEDPLTQQLSSIFAALENSDLQSEACEIFRASLPLCIAEAKTDRHHFQSQMLELATAAVKKMEEDSKTALTEAEEKVSTLRNQGIIATANFEAAQKLAAVKKEQCDAKGKEIEQLQGERDAMKQAVTDAQKAKEDFLAGKAEMIASGEAFQKVLEEMWTPLKGATFSGQQWRKRDKLLAELMEKLQPLKLDASLTEALQAAMRLRLDQRGSFAEKAFTCAEEAFQKHKASLAEQIAGAAAQEEACDKAVVDAEAKHAEALARYTAEDKVSDELQNAWADLETESGKTKMKAEEMDNDIQEAVSDVAERKTELEAAIAVTATFMGLLEPPAVVSPEPVHEENEPAAVVEPAVNMETEAPVAVAAAA